MLLKYIALFCFVLFGARLVIFFQREETFLYYTFEYKFFFHFLDSLLQEHQLFLRQTAFLL